MEPGRVRALIAELIGGEIARALGLKVPEIVFINLDPELGRTEPDPEIQALIKASTGLNLALDYLPGSITFDPVVAKPVRDHPELAAAVVWLDAYLTNIDRTPRNTNLLVWHHELWLIDHGAAMYFHHSWDNYLERCGSAFPQIKDHVLLPFANSIREVDETLAARLTPQVIGEIVRLIPDSWLGDVPQFADVEQHRAAYTDYLLRRLETPRAFALEVPHV